MTCRYGFSRARLETQVDVRGCLEGKASAPTEDRAHFDDWREEAPWPGLSDNTKSRGEFANEDEQRSTTQQRRHDDGPTAT